KFDRCCGLESPRSGSPCLRASVVHSFSPYSTYSAWSACSPLSWFALPFFPFRVVRIFRGWTSVPLCLCASVVSIFHFATTKHKVFVSRWATDWWRTWEVNLATTNLEEIVDHWAPASWRTWEVNFAVKVPSVQ